MEAVLKPLRPQPAAAALGLPHCLVNSPLGTPPAACGTELEVIHISTGRAGMTVCLVQKLQ